MIAATNKAYYEVSLDGGNQFIRKDNLLLTGFYSTLSGSINCLVGEGTAPVNFTDTVMTNTIMSGVGTTVSSITTYDAALDKIVITSQYEFVFAANITKTLTEIGIRQGSTLVSRTLFESAIVVTPTDSLMVRYTLVTEIDMAEYPISLVLGGVSCTGKVIKCNPNKWTQASFGSLKQSAKYGVLINGSYARGADGYLSGSGSVVIAYSCNNTETGGANRKMAACSISSGLEAVDQTFNVLALSDASGATASQILALIVFDAPVLRTSDNIVNISLTMTQVPA